MTHLTSFLFYAVPPIFSFSKAKSVFSFDKLTLRVFFISTFWPPAPTSPARASGSHQPVAFVSDATCKRGHAALVLLTYFTCYHALAVRSRPKM